MAKKYNPQKSKQDGEQKSNHLVKPNEQSRTRSDYAMAENGRSKSNHLVKPNEQSRTRSGYAMAENGRTKFNGIAAMFDRLIEYAKVIESSDWKMGWNSTKNSWTGMPQNISGREYTGGNSFYLMFATMANNYSMPVYATFNQINKLNQDIMDDKGRIPKDKWDQAVHVKKGEASEYAIFSTVQYKNKENPKEKSLTREQYLQLSEEEREKYEEKWINYAHAIFNVDQTNLKEVKPELYEKLKERMGLDERQNFLQDTKGMYAEPAIDYILQNQTWRCPVHFTTESREAFYSPAKDDITIPMKEQFNIPYEEKDLEKDIEKFVTPAMTMKTAIENFSDADRNLDNLKENKDNMDYKTELRGTLMLENTFGQQLGILRQEGQNLKDYAQQIDDAIKNNRENVIAIKNQEAKITGGKDFYATFVHEGAHSMGKELNIDLNPSHDKKGYAREELRAESSAAIIAATLGYGNAIIFNSAAYIRGWNNTASVGEKTKQMKQLQADINSTVKRMGEMIDDAAIKAGVQPIFNKSLTEKQQTNQTQQTSQTQQTNISQSPTPAQTPANQSQAPVDQARADLRSDRKEIGDMLSPTQSPSQTDQQTHQPNDQNAHSAQGTQQPQTDQQTHQPNDQKAQGNDVNDPKDSKNLKDPTDQTDQQTHQPNDQKAKGSNVIDLKDSNNLKAPTDQTTLLEKMMEAAKVHTLGLPDGVKIDYDNGVLTVDKYKEGVKHADFASLPKNEQDALGWSATEILLDGLQNTLKRLAEKTTMDIIVNRPNGDSISLNHGNLDETYNQLSKLEKIGVLNTFASFAEVEAEELFDKAVKNKEDNKIYLEPNNWIQKEEDGSLSIVLIKDNETKKAAFDELNGLTQWSIVSFAVEQFNQTKIQQADVPSVAVAQQQNEQTTQQPQTAQQPQAAQQAQDAQQAQTAQQSQRPTDPKAQGNDVNDPKDSNNLKVPTDQAAQQFSVAKSPDQSVSPQATVEPSQNDQIADTLSPRQKLEAIGYPYKSYNKEDGSYDIPTVNESLYWRYAAGIISLHEAAQEFTKNGWTNFVDEDYTRKQFSILNEKWQRLDDDLNPLSPEQITWHKLSALLMDTNEDIHLKAREDDILVLETDEDMGLSDLEKNRLSEVWQHPTEGIITFKMEGSNQELDLSEFPEFIPQVYNHVLEGDMEKISVRQQLEDKIISLSELAAHTQKDRPSDIVFIRDFDPGKMRDNYTAYGKDADRLAEKVSSSAVTMRPEIEGKRYPYADISGSRIDAVRADMMINNVHPIIIDIEGNRIHNDKTLDYTKEERKKALYEQQHPEAKQLNTIDEMLKRMRYPDSITVPRTHEHPSAEPSLFIPHTYGYQEVALMEIKKAKDGSYKAGNNEDGYYPIAKMDTNNLSEVQQALQKVMANRPQNLVAEMVNQAKEGKAEVSRHNADGLYVITINDRPNELNYPRGFKQFTVGKDMKDHVFLHDDRGGSRGSIVKVDQQTLQQLINYAESKLGIAMTLTQDGNQKARQNDINNDAQKPLKIEDFSLRNVNDVWKLQATVNNRALPPTTVSIQDVKDYKAGRMSQQTLLTKSYGDSLNQKENQTQHRGRGR